MLAYLVVGNSAFVGPVVLARPRFPDGGKELGHAQSTHTHRGIVDGAVVVVQHQRDVEFLTDWEQVVDGPYLFIISYCLAHLGCGFTASSFSRTSWP